MEIPKCPAFVKGDCPRSDPICVSESDAGNTAYTFFCRTCKLPFVITNPRGKAQAALHREISQKKSLRPTERDRIHFDLGRNQR
jgi:hypothetical protein